MNAEPLPWSKEKATRGAGRRHCSHGTQPSPLNTRDAGAPAASEDWRKAQQPPGRLGGGAGSMPAAEGEGVGRRADQSWKASAKRQAPSAGDRQQQPTRDWEGFSRPLLRGDCTRAQKEAWRGEEDESSRPTSPSQLATAPSQNPAAASRRSGGSTSDSLSPLCGLQRRGDGQGERPMRTQLSRSPSDEPRLSGGAGLAAGRGRARAGAQRGGFAAHRESASWGVGA